MSGDDLLLVNHPDWGCMLWTDPIAYAVCYMLWFLNSHFIDKYFSVSDILEDYEHSDSFECDLLCLTKLDLLYGIMVPYNYGIYGNNEF